MSEIRTYRHPVMDYILITIGSIILGWAICAFLEPLRLVTGGVSGIGIILKAILNIPLAVTNIGLNVPLFVCAILIKGKDFGARTVYSTIILTIALHFFEGITPVTNDFILGSVFGGIVSGVGMGMVFASHGTTGGTDLLASMIQHFLKYFSLSRVILVIDGIIVVSGLYIFGVENALYALICIYVSTKVIDIFLEGVHYSKAAFIISEKNEEIADKLMNELDRGVTGLNGRGHYSKLPKEVLLCVVSKREIVRVKDIVKDIDVDAFLIVADVREVVGEGFIEYKNSKMPLNKNEI